MNKRGDAYLRLLKRELGLKAKDEVSEIINSKFEQVKDPGKLLVALFEVQEEPDIVEQMLIKS
jgi:hypothetical protein